MSLVHRFVSLGAAHCSSCMVLRLKLSNVKFAWE
jgi:hypothetical protein